MNRSHTLSACATIARRVVQALSNATGEEVDDIMSPIGDVAAWLGLDR